MANARRGKPSRDETRHAAPGQMVTLTATAQHRPPQVAHCRAKGTQRRTIHRHPIVAEVTQQDRAQGCSLFPNGRVLASLQFFFQSSQFGLPPLPHRLSQHREVTLLGFPATMREAQKVERLRFAVAAVSSVPLRIAAKLDDSRLVGMQLQSELREALAQFRQKPLEGLAVYPSSCVLLNRKVRCPQSLDVEDVVQERGEPLFLILSCCLSYPLKRAERATPALSPERVALGRVPLGPFPSLHRLRCRSLGICSATSQVLWNGPTSRACSSSAYVL